MEQGLAVRAQGTEVMEVSEEMIFQCFAAAKVSEKSQNSAESFVDVEEYENRIMYPEFSKWAKKAGYPEIAKLFLNVAREEGQHAQWLRKLYQEIGVPKTGEDTLRAKNALATIKKNCDKIFSLNPAGAVEKALMVALRVEEREYKEIYPRFRDQALAEGNHEAAAVYQKVIDSEQEHASWFKAALNQLKSTTQVASFA